MGKASRRKVERRVFPRCLRCDRRFDPTVLYPLRARRPTLRGEPGPSWCQACVRASLVRSQAPEVWDALYPAAETGPALKALLERSWD